MILELQGRARVLGSGINTDYIIASSRKKETLDPHALKRWLLEGVDPAFSASVRPGDILVAGDAFGCGSAMEVAVTVVLAAGIRVVVAKSFSRTYFRNAVNNGLVPVECDTGFLMEGDAVRVRVGSAGGEVTRLEDGCAVQATPLPDFLLQILTAGGLVPYLEARGGFVEAGR